MRSDYRIVCYNYVRAKSKYKIATICITIYILFAAVCFGRIAEIRNAKQLKFPSSCPHHQHAFNKLYGGWHNGNCSRENVQPGSQCRTTKTTPTTIRQQAHVYNTIEKRTCSTPTPPFAIWTCKRPVQPVHGWPYAYFIRALCRSKHIRAAICVYVRMPYVHLCTLYSIRCTCVYTIPPHTDVDRLISPSTSISVWPYIAKRDWVVACNARNDDIVTKWYAPPNPPRPFRISRHYALWTLCSRKLLSIECT